MRTRMKRPLGCMLTVVVTAALMVSLWRSWTTLAHPDDLDGILMILQKYRVESYRDQIWCRNVFSDGRGYSTNFTSSTCNLSRLTPEPFNEEGEALFRAVRRSLKKAGVDVVLLFTHYSSDGIISSVELAVDTVIGTKSYVYSRDGTPPSPFRSYITKLDTHWFYVEGQDWR